MKDDYREKGNRYIPPSRSIVESIMEEILVKLLKGQENKETNLKEIKDNISGLTQKVESHATTIKQLEHRFRQMLATLNQRHPGTLPHIMVQNPNNDVHVRPITMGSGITTMDPPIPTTKVVNNKT